MIPSSRNY
ncbi:uncharacterized protein ARMOST_17553 [Armillaria ostoyae]|uniref:Uncharacterized protein n=1 Tax=Armillaria ostoyae TaxID=47428 RepID=A0A284RZB6_ARMOS|nr:uncharacterized protein ARMOST_17553 [Armillaria ostoyae]